MQRREIKDRQAAHDAFIRIGQVLRDVVIGLIKLA
jgi:hypothetical protein